MTLIDGPAHAAGKIDGGGELFIINADANLLSLRFVSDWLI